MPRDAPVTTATGFDMGGIYRIAGPGRHPGSELPLRVILRERSDRGIAFAPRLLKLVLLRESDPSVAGRFAPAPSG